MCMARHASGTWLRHDSWATAAIMHNFNTNVASTECRSYNFPFHFVDSQQFDCNESDFVFRNQWLLLLLSQVHEFGTSLTWIHHTFCFLPVHVPILVLIIHDWWTYVAFAFCFAGNRRCGLNSTVEPLCRHPPLSQFVFQWTWESLQVRNFCTFLYT